MQLPRQRGVGTGRLRFPWRSHARRYIYEYENGKSKWHEGCSGQDRQIIAKPNIVFLLADDLRPDCLGVLGHPIVKTPNLDKLLENGFVFRNAYVLGSHSGAVCMPSRSMIQTGVSYFRKQRTTPTLAETIKGAGYASIRSGKFGNNPNELDKPFDQHLDGNSSEGDANNIIRFIGENAGKKPLFLYMAVHEPHDPQFAAQEFYQMYLPEKIPLPQNFLPFHPFDNTLFVVAGDNGLSLGEHGLLGKQNLYEFGGMHVPLIFAGPGIKKGETKSFAYLFDVYPTMCEFAGIPIPAGLDAKSLAPVITGNQPKVHDLLFTAYKNCQRSIRNDRWKLICYPQINKTQLFDLQADPHEMKDLAVEPKGGEKKMKKRKKAK